MVSVKMKRDNGEGDEVRPSKASISKSKSGHANVRADAAQHVLLHCSQLWQGLPLLARSMNWPSGQEATMRLAKS